MIWTVPGIMQWAAQNKGHAFDIASCILFVLIVAFLVVRHKKKLDFQVMLKIFGIPVIYAVLWRTRFGLKFMDKVAGKNRELVKLIGYCFIGFAFWMMIKISYQIAKMLYLLFISPKETSQGVSLILPLTNIPGVGYLSFWYFIIVIFVVVLIHEFAHGIMARAHGIPVKSSGLGVFSLIAPIFPIAFVEPDEKKMKKEKDLVQYSVFAAGPMINIVLAMALLIAFPFVLDPAIPAPFEDRLTDAVGVSFTALMPDYPAASSGMKPGMILDSVDGEKIYDSTALSNRLRCVPPGNSVIVGTDQGDFNITLKPAPDDPSRGYMGISGIMNERRIKDDHKALGGVFFWFKGLIRWLFIINFAVGLMNLLPLIVTDGGRMLKTALEKVLGDAKKADKIWIILGVLFIGTLLLSFLTKYAVKLLAMVGIG